MYQALNFFHTSSSPPSIISQSVLILPSSKHLLNSSCLTVCQVRDQKGKHIVFLICPLSPSATALGQALTVFHPDSSVDLFSGISALDAFRQSISPEGRQDSQTRQNPLDLTLTQNSWPATPLSNAVVCISNSGTTVSFEMSPKYISYLEWSTT